MAYVKGEPPGQSSLFPPSLDELVADDHPVRVIEAYVGSLNLGALGFKHAEPSVMGRPCYDPADLLKLYVYGYMNRVRTSRRLETECKRNVEVMWLLGKLAPDHKTIADFRRINGEAFIQVCRGFVRFCAEAKLLAGTLVAVDGSKFQAVSSKRRVMTRQSLADESRKLDARIAQYLKGMDEADREERGEPIDRSAVRAAVEKLKTRKADCDSARAVLDELGENQHVTGEAEARLMPTPHGHAVAYNVQIAVDAEHGLIVHHEVINEVNDKSQLEPIAKAAREVLGGGDLKVVADKGYSGGAQFQACEDAGITPYVPPLRAAQRVNRRFYVVDDFKYDEKTDTLRCPASKVLTLKQICEGKHRIYQATAHDCGSCTNKPQCTAAARRMVTRHWHEAAFARMAERLAKEPDMMIRRQSTVEHPFAQLKQGVMGNGRLLVKGLVGARAEIALAVLVRNLKRVMNILGRRAVMARLAPA